jgi:uncharacterized membrane protein YdjX (TVP38/TMEM64 family)
MLGGIADRLSALDDVVSSLGPAGPPAYALLVVVSGLLPLPMFNLLLLGAGSLFGMPSGFGIVYPSALLGACVGFRVGRQLPETLRRRIPQKLTVLQDALAEGGFVTLLLLRLTPLPFAPSNLFLGSIPAIPFWTYLLATAIGFLRLVANVFIGSQLRGMIDGQGTFVESAILVGGAVAFALAVGNTGRLLLKRRAAKGKAE